MNLGNLTLPKRTLSFDLSKWAGLAAPGTGIVVSFLIIFLVIWPRLNDALQMQKSNKELEVTVASFEEKAQRLASLDKNQLIEQLVAAEQLLPSDKGVFTFIRQVENSANSSGVLLNRIEVVAPGLVGTGSPSDSSSAPPPPPPQPPSLDSSSAQAAGNLASATNFKISVESDYQSFLRFLNIIFSLPRVVTVDDLVITSSALAGQPAQIRIALALSAYWKSLPMTLSSVESPIEVLTAPERERLDKVVIVKGPEGAPAATVPSVPLGRPDLFAPF